MSRSRRAWVQKEEPKVIWEDEDIAVILKGPAWIVAIARNDEKNIIFKKLLQNRGITSVDELLNTGTCEHLCHYMMLKFKGRQDYTIHNDPDLEFGLAHRLDVNTSGAILVGKTETGFWHLRESFNRKEIMKEYLCLVHGAIQTPNGTIDKPIRWNEATNTSIIFEGGLWARSLYTVVGYYRCVEGGHVCTLCRVVIITGRTHQIRVHMLSIGHPLVGDSKYYGRHTKTDNAWCPRIFLHAWRIGFSNCSNEYQEIKAPLTADLVRALRNLEEVKFDPGRFGGPSCRRAATTPEIASPAHGQTEDTGTPKKSALDDVSDSPPTRDANRLDSAKGVSPWQVPVPPPGGAVGDGFSAIVGARTLVMGLSSSSMGVTSPSASEVSVSSCASAPDFDMNLTLLLTMGFDKRMAEDALKSNNGDLTEALDQLTNSSVQGSEINVPVPLAEERGRVRRWRTRKTGEGDGSRVEVAKQQPVTSTKALVVDPLPATTRNDIAAEQRNLDEAIQASMKDSTPDQRNLENAIQVSMKELEDNNAEQIAIDAALAASRITMEQERNSNQLELMAVESALSQSAQVYVNFHASASPEELLEAFGCISVQL